MKPIHMLMALAVMAIWGTNFAVSRQAVQEIQPLLLMAVRFSLVALVLVPFVKPPPRAQMRALLFYSISLGGVHFPLMLSGLTGVTASIASLIIQLQVPFASLLAAIFFKDKLGWRRALGMATSFGGVAVIAGQSQGQGDLLHMLLIAGAALAFAFSSIQLKWMGAIEPLQLNAYMALFAAPQLALLSLIAERDQLEQIMQASGQTWACLAYMALMSTIVAYMFWQPLVKQYEVNQTMPFLMLVPVFGVGSGVIWLGEPLHWSLIAGGLLVVAGIGIIIIRRPRFMFGRTTV
ncbi:MULTISPECIES: DMT family transporter [unclassified Azospirillum]|uniref:DMT family transporter n=1 Tax=unclassified Azospirillum TaxID=2630922 RepID=UPI000B700D56|nr:MULTISPECIES: EamA family transporter [unclassified Azospirillum]SNR92798.1 O-acetylserine/cysteine efflux transporter [Azospirillum sp. RU38E]SNS08725.1 O-acetylserine/cysteine efflux transporter [Azospirillum sp. RU37A]